MAATGVPPSRRLGTDQARTKLPGLVDTMRRKRKPARHLLDNAYAIGPRRAGGAFLVPELDAIAALERIEQLEQELEDVAVELLLHGRSGEASSSAVPLDELVAELGFTAEELKRKS